MVVSVLLLLLDHSSSWFHHARNEAEVLVVPLEYTVDLPIRAASSAITDVTSRSSLIEENAALKAELALQQGKMQELLATKSDNKALLQLLQSSDKVGGRVLEAQIIAVALDPFEHELVVDKGSTANVFVGQPVLDAYGVMGQVVQTSLLTSRVMLITDSQSAIPVQDSRSGFRAIAYGDAQTSSLSLKGVQQTADFKVGDLLIASGLGERYPFGYPVAKITQVVNQPDNHFSTILATPLAHLSRTRLVLLVWPNKTPIAPVIKKSMRQQAKKNRDKRGANEA